MHPDDPAAGLLKVLKDIDVRSADGRAGLATLLAEIEHRAPGAILRHAAALDLEHLESRGAAPAGRDRGAAV